MEEKDLDTRPSVRRLEDEEEAWSTPYSSEDLGGNDEELEVELELHCEGVWTTKGASSPTVSLGIDRRRASITRKVSSDPMCRAGGYIPRPSDH